MSSGSRIGVVVLVLVVFLASAHHIRAEYFSSVDRLQTLNDVELRLVNVFRRYLDAQQKEIRTYRKFLKIVKHQHELAMYDVEDYLGNPINAYSLIKRMYADWSRIHEAVQMGEARREFREVLDQLRSEVQFPDEQELRGAVQGLARLQKFYQLNATDLAEGQLNDLDYETKLSWSDCFEVASNMYDLREFPLAISWFELTLAKLKALDDSTRVKFQLASLEYLALAKYELGRVEEAVAHIDEILAVVPDHVARDTKRYMLLNEPMDIERPPSTEEVVAGSSWFTNYTRLCQGHVGDGDGEQRQRSLQCRLETKNRHPLLLLAPLRMEPLSLDPEISIYHGVLSDRHIENILLEARQEMDRSLVTDDGTTNTETDYRISQQAWLDYESPSTRYARRMAAAISGLDATNAEEMQVANYGVGGQYHPHFDFFGPEKDTLEPLDDDRISTNMFYLSDVEQGGFTVFPKLNLYVRPVKGALVTWYNLHRSLGDDYRMLHAGCPVIVGSKRIANIWIHSNEQEFQRPCHLERDDFKSKFDEQDI